MSYSRRYRERTIEYRQAGHSLEATHQVFKVSKSTIQKWEKQLKETGNLEKKDLHSKKRLLFAAQNAGCRLLFLPPYSPELNPIEHFWAWLKRFLRKILPSATSFDDALSTAFQLW